MVKSEAESWKDMAPTVNKLNHGSKWSQRLASCEEEPSVGYPAEQDMLLALGVPVPVSLAFCTEFVIIRKPETRKDFSYFVIDFNGKELYKFADYSLSDESQVLHDGHGQVLLSFKQKKPFSTTWHAYRGYKTHKEEHLLFTLTKPAFEWRSPFKARPDYRITFPGNENDEFALNAVDFPKSQFKICRNGAVIGEANWKGSITGEHQQVVTLTTGIDPAFIASILVTSRIIEIQTIKLFMAAYIEPATRVSRRN